MPRNMPAMVGTLCVVLLIGSSASAYSRLGTVVKQRYGLRSVSCNTCHVKGQKKEVVNPFGRVLAGLLEGKHLSERFAAAKKVEEEQQREKVLGQIDKELQAALKKFDKMEAPCGMTYAEALQAGRIEGTKLQEER